MFLGDNHACNIVGFGDVKLVFVDGIQLMLHNVRHVPEVKKNLISTGMLDDEGYVTSFGHVFWKVTKGALVVARGPKVDTMYTLHAKLCNHTDIHATEMPKISMWHNRLHGGFTSSNKETSPACKKYMKIPLIYPLFTGPYLIKCTFLPLYNPPPLHSRGTIW